jgi:hypothetical protein
MRLLLFLSQTVYLVFPNILKLLLFFSPLHSTMARPLLPFFFMGRPLRYLPHPNTTFEVTCRTIQGRLLLKPSPELNDLILGVFGRALFLYPSVLLHLFVVVSNHMHIILTTPDSQTLSLFMNHLNSNIAREAGKLHGWREKFWGRRYRAIPILDDQALSFRIQYLLSHGCKEGLVHRPEEWPGAHCLNSLLYGKSLSGTWYDRTKEYLARRALEDVETRRFATTYEVRLAPLPGWEDLPTKEQQQRFKTIVSAITIEVQKNRKEQGPRSFFGKKEILSQHPHTRPEKIKKAAAPSCHCSCPEKRKEYRISYRYFVDLFKTAAQKLRNRRLPVEFPDHCFLPTFGYAKSFTLEPLVLSFS